MIFGEAEHIRLPPMCDNEPKGTEILPFQAAQVSMLWLTDSACFLFAEDLSDLNDDQGQKRAYQHQRPLITQQLR